jgi:hypothetical protein
MICYIVKMGDVGPYEGCSNRRIEKVAEWCVHLSRIHFSYSYVSHQTNGPIEVIKQIEIVKW